MIYALLAHIVEVVKKSVITAPLGISAWIMHQVAPCVQVDFIVKMLHQNATRVKLAHIAIRVPQPAPYALPDS